MKPNFALSLSFDGIRLLHRVSGGWHLVGEVALDTEDMGAELGQLRRTALALDSTGLRTKLLLPNEQIKYFAIDNPRAEQADVEAALDGVTPYAVEDLVYDYSQGGGRTYVAAVALETLAEAESFATGFKLNPVCFAAVPDDFSFVGEAFFGATEHARITDPDNLPTKDDEAVSIIGRAHMPEPENTAPLAAETPTVAPTEAPTETLTETLAETLAEALPEAPEPSPEVVPVEPPVEAAAIDPETVLDLPEDLSEVAEAMAAQSDLFPDLTPEAPQAETAEQEAAQEVVFSSRARPAIADEPDRAPAAPAPAAPPTEVDGRTEPTFASRARKPAPPPAEPTLSAAPEPSSAAPAVVTDTAPVGDAPQLAASRDAAPVNAAPAPTMPNAGQAPKITFDPVEIKASKTGAEIDIAALQSGLRETVEPKSKIKLPSFGILKAGAALLRTRPAKKAKTEQKKAETPAATKEAERLTVFGARKPQKAVGGKPRFLLLLLTLGLLLFMAAIAAWATWSDDTLARWIRGDAPVTQFAEETEVLPVPEISDEALFDLETAAADASEEPVAAAETTQETAPQPAAVTGTILTPAEAQRIYAATGVWQRAPRLPFLPRTSSSDDVVIPAIDPVTIGTDAVALPVAFPPDALIFAPTNPPAIGTVFPRDDSGFILATPEGTLLPDGVLIFAGRPDLVPPLRPLAQAPDTDASVETALATADNPLAGLRPQARPAGLVEQIERNELGGFTVDELATLRPRARPAGLVPTPDPAVESAVAGAVTAATTTDVAAIAAAIATAAPAPSPVVGATARAVAASPRPDLRPRNIAQIVNAAASAPAPVAVTSSATIQPTGSIPRSVASAATDDNAINLRDLNLIGIAGSSNNRTAIIRLTNGRFVRVGVGDQFNGGQVTAISESAINYVKNGRTFGLEMP